MVRRTENFDISKELMSWLLEESYDVWLKYGKSSTEGLFNELLNFHYEPIYRDHRARLHSRQIFCYGKLGHLFRDDRGFSLDAYKKVLINHFIDRSNNVITSIDASYKVRSDSEDLYDVAFVLFALSTIYECSTYEDEIETLAITILNKVNESNDLRFGPYRINTTNYLANPNMHLLEALISWFEVSKNQKHFWRVRAKNLAINSVEVFYRQHLNCIVEEVRANNSSTAHHPKVVIEPGHQYEWSWLLLKCDQYFGTDFLEKKISKIISKTERFGIDKNNYCYSSLAEDFSVVDSTLKLWPNCERAKFWHRSLQFKKQFDKLFAEVDCVSQRDYSLFNVSNYLNHPSEGLWYENFTSDYKKIDEPIRASSWYHIVACILEVNNLLSKEM